jgi:hypothetical protein
MALVFNLFVVGLAALIAYWWANQGFFSALLHFICVVCAGAVALALWEPLTVGFALRGGWLDEYVWGITLLGVFVVSLFLFRLAFDKLVPDNVNLPTWANYTFGTLFGAGAGIITVGISMIGLGMLQSSDEMLGYRGHVRSSDNRGQPAGVSTLYPPLHTWTADFYSMLSGGALAPTFTRASLQSSYPGLDDMSWALWRDGAFDGEAKSSLAPAAATIESALFSQQSAKAGPGGSYGVMVNFQKDAFDRGEMLIVSASQVRLIGRTRDGRPVAVHPTRWSQLTERGQAELPFDDVSHYATSPAGAAAARIAFMFPASAFEGGQPESIQIKGLRFALPKLETVDQGGFIQWIASLSGSMQRLEFDQEAPFVDEGEMKVDATIAPLNLSTNQVSGFDVVDNYLARGRAEFSRRNEFNPGRALRIKGILEAPGTKIVKVDVSRKADKAIDFWGDRGDARSRAGAAQMPLLVSADGRAFPATGYIWIRNDKVEIRLDPSRPLRGLGDIPQLSSAGTDTLQLLFSVTDGAHIIGLMLGQIQPDGSPKGVTLANCDIVIGKPEAPANRGGLSAP